MSSPSSGMHGAQQDSKRARKRKREPGQDIPSGVSGSGRPDKQLRKGNAGNLQPPDVVKHALLAQYYPTILTLRQYVLASLPASSRIRRKKISAVGRTDQAAAEDAHPGVQGSAKGLDHTRTSLARLLDTTIVTTHVYPTAVREPQPDGRSQRRMEYSQKGDNSYMTLSESVASTVPCQAEVGSLYSCGWTSVEGHRHLVRQELTGTRR